MPNEMKTACINSKPTNQVHAPPCMVDGCPELPASTCGNAGPVIWPETEIGQVASVPCPCGVSNDPLIQELRGTRRCGGTYDTGAMWEEPQCVSCQFSNTRLTLCRLAEVGSCLSRMYLYYTWCLHRFVTWPLYPSLLTCANVLDWQPSPTCYWTGQCN